MPITQTKHYGSGDNTWLASDHGLFNAKTFTLDAAAFKAIQDANGKVPSGYPVGITADKVTPWTGTGEWLGHLLFDQDASKGDCLVPVMTHGIAYSCWVIALLDQLDTRRRVECSVDRRQIDRRRQLQRHSQAIAKKHRGLNAGCRNL